MDVEGRGQSSVDGTAAASRMGEEVEDDGGEKSNHGGENIR
jgi:hypothetical protein